ncbi:unnamed protein product [Moneuplotes crassus]|uniref:Uncharacterized protein n=2 Tax=Euplotes crassus TaxID=5936 RepID=A0AAD1USQ7_EUPCR|nr:unnamed protein product [Moneuplotes crassus]
MEIGKSTRNPLNRVIVFDDWTKPGYSFGYFSRLAKRIPMLLYEVKELKEVRDTDFRDISFLKRGLENFLTIKLSQVGGDYAQLEEFNDLRGVIGYSEELGEIILRDLGYQVYHDDSHDFFLKNPKRIQMLIEILVKLKSNWNGFKKNQSEFSKLVKSLKNICEGHFNNEAKKEELKDDIPNVDLFNTHLIKQLFASGILSNWLFSKERQLEDYSITSLESLVSGFRVIKEGTEKEYISEVDKLNGQIKEELNKAYGSYNQ